MDIKFTIDKFEGPLDLLLHLIKENNIDIIDINISEVAHQYFEYIKKMEELDLNIGSEYLIMASELTYIKSKTLLPCVEEDEEEDPKENLINRLIEYQRYKEVTGDFKELETARKNLFSKEPSYLNEFKENKLIIDENITLDDLIKAFENLNIRKENEKPLNMAVTKKEYSVSQRSLEILDRLKKNKIIEFSSLFSFVNKEYVVVTFLSLLELAKKGRLKLAQEGNMKQIIIKGV